MSAALRQTPLHGRHERLGARMVEFAGWSMPVQYDGILAEHERTRTDASVFDTGHMGAFLVEGAGALDALSQILTADLRALPDQRCGYGFILNEQGGILDDLITYRFESGRWMLVVNAGTRERDGAWLSGHLPRGVRITDLSAGAGKLDVQGPRAQPAVEAVLAAAFGTLPRFGFCVAGAGRRAVTVSRTGYTGEDGYELYAAHDVIAELWDALIARGVRPAGLGARDTLRLECGLPLYGHELTEDLSPLEANLLRFACKEEDFIGRAALLDRRRRGPAYRLTGFKLAGRQSARHGDRVRSGEADVGWVTSGSFAPTLGVALGMAYVPPPLAGAGGRFRIDTGRRMLEAEGTPLPFYRRRSGGDAA
jgi:aminomethyltransferase